jgi:hypothetical protein
MDYRGGLMRHRRREREIERILPKQQLTMTVVFHCCFVYFLLELLLTSPLVPVSKEKDHEVNNVMQGWQLYELCRISLPELW